MTKIPTDGKVTFTFTVTRSGLRAVASHLVVFAAGGTVALVALLNSGRCY